jgi:hypothetical protein
MTWRERFVFYFGNGYFCGITLGDWFALLRENGFRIAPSCFLRAASITALSIPNTVTCWLERARYRRRWEEVDVRAPLFVLGHYRSGTTHLHNLLSVDPRFGYLNVYQASYPDSFLLTERLNSRFFGFFLPGTRQFDNVPLGLNVPYEEEIAMTNATQLTPYMSVVFPGRQRHYDRFLTFRDATPEELARWRAGLVTLLRKVTLKSGKPLVLKSPPHTCRIRLLLEMFPDARFVHIHRDPYTVIQSTMHLIRVGLEWVRLQNADSVDWTERALSQWREMYDVYFTERSLIPAGNLHEMAFADLERNPLVELRRMYESLSLPPFDEVEPQMKAYLASIADYKKNTFRELPPELKARIAETCSRGFEEWGYPR